MRLYDTLISGNGYKLRLLLRLLGTSFERVEVDILRGESRTPEFLALNPNGRIPLLVLDDGTALAESNAILFFLAHGSRYLPRSRLAQAQVLQWMFFEQYSHEPNIATSRFILMHCASDKKRLAELPQKRTAGHAALGVMESHLQHRPYFVEDSYTIADIALYAYTHVAHEGDFDLSPYPAVRRWLARVASQPGHTPITQA